MKTKSINIKDIRRALRFDGSFQLSDSVVYENLIEGHKYLRLSTMCSSIFTSGRNKRTYTDESKGYPFLSNSDMIAADPFTACKYMSKKYTDSSDGFLKHNMVLTGRVGAIGQTAYVSKRIEGCNAIGSDNIIRIVCKDNYYSGYVYAFLTSKIGNIMLWKYAAGGVQPYITDKMVGQIPIPQFTESFQIEIDEMIQESARLRDEAAVLLAEADAKLKEYNELRPLTPDDYDYYGPRNADRRVSCFVRNRKDITSTTINAFNHSERILRMKELTLQGTIPISSIIENGQTFSTGSFPRIETKNGKGVMLINQMDIFGQIIRGKWISKRNVKLDSLVEYGEVLIAGVGTMGENETFCRAIFANEDLQGQLVSGEFIRMKTKGEVPSGYLYAWLCSEYGFRLIRNIEAGTKLCRPIPKLFLEIPVPLATPAQMEEIDSLVRFAHTLRHKANKLELDAIARMEAEIEQWSKS